MYKFLSFLILFVALWAGPACAAAGKAVPKAGNAVTQAFVKSGVHACANRIEQVTDFLGKNGQTGAAVFVAPQAPDQQMASASLEVMAPDKNSAYSSITTAPVGGGKGCNAVYDAVTWWPKECPAVLAEQFPGQKVAGVLRQNVSVVKMGENVRVFLMPTADGCIAIKKEIVF